MQRLRQHYQGGDGRLLCGDRITIRTRFADRPDGEGRFPTPAEAEGICPRCLRAERLAMDRRSEFIRGGFGPPPDLTKIRRRCEDALRKTATPEKLLRVAALLGVKTE